MQFHKEDQSYTEEIHIDCTTNGRPLLEAEVSEQWNCSFPKIHILTFSRYILYGIYSYLPTRRIIKSLVANELERMWKPLWFIQDTEMTMKIIVFV